MAYFRLNAGGAIQVMDTDVATIPAQSDPVYRVAGRRSLLIHIEMQSRRQAALARRLWRYHALLDLKYDLRVLAEMKACRRIDSLKRNVRNHDSIRGFRQTSRWILKNVARDTLRSAAIESDSRRLSAPDIGVKAWASSMLRSMNSSLGMPKLARLTGSESE